jgi:hypothetical protein
MTGGQPLFGTKGTFQTVTYTASNTDLVNSTPVIINGVKAWHFKMVSDASWNGSVSIQTQKNDGTWVDSSAAMAAASMQSVESNAFDEYTNNAVATAVSYPWNLRVLIKVAATLGTVAIQIDTIS